MLYSDTLKSVVLTTTHDGQASIHRTQPRRSLGEGGPNDQKSPRPYALKWVIVGLALVARADEEVSERQYWLAVEYHSFYSVAGEFQRL